MERGATRQLIEGFARCSSSSRDARSESARGLSSLRPLFSMSLSDRRASGNVLFGWQGFHICDSGEHTGLERCDGVAVEVLVRSGCGAMSCERAGELRACFQR